MTERKSNVEDEWVGGGDVSGRCQLAEQFLDIKDNEKPVQHGLFMFCSVTIGLQFEIKARQILAITQIMFALVSY